MSSTSIPIRTRSVPDCALCGTPGRLLYEKMSDRSFAAPGEWNIRKCPREGCGLVWLDPQPTEEDIGLAYQGYYTHSQPAPGPSLARDICWGIWHSYLGARFGYTQGVGPRWRRAFAPLALLHPGGRAELDAAAMHLRAPRGPSRLLDVGCGSGVMTARMQALGWEVEGVEFDPAAAEAARSRGVSVRLGTLEAQKYAADSFDAVHSAHVIEHLHDPVGMLRESFRILKPGGKVITLTPNVESWGHEYFARSWLNLDPPRHLVLFSVATLRTAAERCGFGIERIEATVRTAWVYGALSYAIRRTGRGEMSELGRPLSLLRGFLYQLRERWRSRRHPQAGDELLLIARKPG